MLPIDFHLQFYYLAVHEKKLHLSHPVRERQCRLVKEKSSSTQRRKDAVQSLFKVSKAQPKMQEYV
jgi:hypothetical protein